MNGFTEGLRTAMATTRGIMDLDILSLILLIMTNERMMTMVAE